MSKKKYWIVLALLMLFFASIPVSAGSEEREVFRYIQSLKGTEAARRIAPLIVDSSKRHGLNPLLIANVMRVESDFYPKEVSSAGALGLMQVMPCHFESHGIPRSRRFDPKTNIELGCRIYAYYQKMMSKRYPGLNEQALRHRTLVAYNMGPRAVVSRGIYRSRYSQVILNYYQQARAKR